MIKTLSLLQRASTYSKEQFREHWTGTHVPMSSTLKALRGYAVSEVTGALTRPDVSDLGTDGKIDGIAETWVENEAARKRHSASPQAQAWFADGAKFLSSVEVFVTEERVIVPPPMRNGPHAKMVSFLVRREGMPVDTFMDHWINEHGLLATAVPGIKGFVLSLVHEQFSRADLAPMGLPKIDGIATTWFESLDERAKLAGAPEAIRWRADGATFIGNMVTFVTKEHVVLWPSNRRPTSAP